MIGTSERRSAQFLEWEARGRGHLVWPHPVSPEPPFTPFLPSVVPQGEDDGRKPTFLSSAIRRLSARLAPHPPNASRQAEECEELPDVLERGNITEFQAYLPAGLKFDPGTYASLFAGLAPAMEPVAFELVGTRERVTAQFAVHPSDGSLVLSQLNAFVPDVGFAPASGYLAGLWGALDGSATAVAEFGLAREFLLPLRGFRADPFVGVVGALSDIGPNELALFQVMFAPASPHWRESALRSVTHADGSALFVNAPELLPAAKEKTYSPLFGAVVRVAVRAENHDRAWQIAVNVAAALGVYGSPTANELVPLRNDGYPADVHAEDVIRRQSRRSGMILNAAELAGFVHLPSSDVKSPRLRAEIERTKEVPAFLRSVGGVMIGENVHAGMVTPVFLSEEQRVRHLHIVGASGTGKSTLLFNLIRQDIENGRGCSVLDPHGDLIDRVLGVIPEERIDDVVLLDPSDDDYSIGFNVLVAHSDGEKSLLASDLVAVFRRLSSSWGDQLNSVLSNALLAFMESERGGTLFDVRRFLLEPKFRADFLKCVRDPNVLYYWRHAFPMLTGNRSVGPVVTRLDAFLSAKPIRHMVAQKVNRLDFGDILDSRRIFLAKLPEGIVGKENAHLLGSLLVSKMQAAAMARQRKQETARQFHVLFADEFHSFLTPSLAECLSGVRKYRLGLALAHQEMRQVERDPDVASALLNAGTRIVFRVNDRDARALEGGFSSFEARDLQNLATGHAVCRVERSDCDFNLAVRRAEDLDEDAAHERRARVAAASRAKYGTLRTEIDRAFVIEVSPPEPEKKEAPRNRSSASPETASPTEAPPVPAGECGASAVTVPIPTEPRVAPLNVCADVVVDKACAPVTDLGRGGAQHKAIQQRIKKAGEARGFRVTVEQEVLEGAGAIDLVLVRGEITIACEVTVTTTIDHEVGNIAKCVKAEFANIAVVSASAKKLSDIKAAVLASLGTKVADTVGYYDPDGFIEYLALLPPPKSELPGIKVLKGYKVKTHVAKLSPEEAKAREDAGLKLIANAMAQAKKRGRP